MRRDYPADLTFRRIGAIVSHFLSMASWIFLGLILLPNAARCADPAMDYDRSCTDAACHGQPTAGDHPIHLPYLEEQCLTCHVDHGTSIPGLLRPGGDQLCLDCHSGMEIQTDKPGLAHPPGGQSCLSCHAPHESPVRGLLRDDEHLLACAQCHEPFLDAESQRPYHHRYFDPETQCGNCHYAHQRREQQYLREDVSQMCLTCHTLAIRHQDRYLEQIGWKLNHLPHKHEVMNQGFCPVCHTPHGSDQASLLTAGYPSGSYETYRTEQYSLCWGCHDPQLVESATGLNFTAFRNATENLHRVHVSQMRRGRACHLCHEAHASAQAHLIRPRLKFEKWEASLTWQPLADGGRCLSPCHREKEYHH